jgi:hypothetical protein
MKPSNTTQLTRTSRVRDKPIARVESRLLHLFFHSSEMRHEEVIHSQYPWWFMQIGGSEIKVSVKRLNAGYS